MYFICILLNLLFSNVATAQSVIPQEPQNNAVSSQADNEESRPASAEDSNSVVPETNGTPENSTGTEPASDNSALTEEESAAMNATGPDEDSSEDISSSTDLSSSLGNGPWETGEIAVRGNKNLKTKVLIKTGSAKKGRLYRSSDVSKDVETFMGLGSLENVSVDIEPLDDREVSEKNRKETSFPRQVRVVYTVEEKPAIKKINIKGYKRLSSSSIKDAMDTKEKDFLDEFRLGEDMRKIEEKYNSKGFIDAKASYEKICSTETLLCVIDVNVTEGPKAIVEAVEFTGVSAFREKKLRKKLQNRPKKKYDPKMIQKDLAALSLFYKDRGYADFKVNSSSVTFNETRSGVTFHIDVEEGEMQYFGATFFSGNEIYMPGDFTGDIAYKRGKKYNQELFSETLAAIQNRYADKGYLKADISYDRSKNEKTGETDITFYIAEHDPVYVGHIDIAGNEATKSYVFRREVAQK